MGKLISFKFVDKKKNNDSIEIDTINAADQQIANLEAEKESQRLESIQKAKEEQDNLRVAQEEEKRKAAEQEALKINQELERIKQANKQGQEVLESQKQALEDQRKEQEAIEAQRIALEKQRGEQLEAKRLAKEEKKSLKQQKKQKKKKESNKKSSERKSFFFFNKKRDKFDSLDTNGNLEYEQYKIKKHRKRIQRRFFFRLCLIVICLFGAFKGFMSASNEESNIFLEQEFIKQYVNVFNQKDDNAIQTMVKDYSLDTDNLLTRSSYRYISFAQIISREYKGSKINYVIKTNVTTNNSVFSNLYTLELMTKDGKYLVTKNISPITINSLKIDDSSIIEKLREEQQKSAGSLVNEEDQIKLESTIDVFFTSYNSSYEQLKKSSLFDLKKYGDGLFDVSSIVHKSCNTQNEKYKCVILINNKSVSSIIKMKMIIVVNKDFQVEKIE